jgi:hypothetical protein
MVRFIKKLFSGKVPKKVSNSINQGLNPQSPLTYDDDKDRPRIKRYWNPRTGAIQVQLENF